VRDARKASINVLGCEPTLVPSERERERERESAMLSMGSPPNFRFDCEKSSKSSHVAHGGVSHLKIAQPLHHINTSTHRHTTNHNTSTQCYEPINTSTHQHIDTIINTPMFRYGGVDDCVDLGATRQYNTSTHHHFNAPTQSSRHHTSNNSMRTFHYRLFSCM
jgi:hypothetical protein